MQILNIYNNVSNTSIPLELEEYMAQKFKKDHFKHIAFKSVFQVFRKLTTIIASIDQADVVHSHHTFSSVALTFFRLLFLNKKKLFVCTVHRNYKTAGKLTTLAFALLVFPFRDIIICNSHSTRASLPWYVRTFFKDRVRVVYNGVDLSKIDACVNVPGSPVELVSVGRLVVDKDHLTILKMCSVLKDSGFSFHLRICGGGQLEAMLMREITTRGLSGHVSLLGNISRSNVYNILNKSSIFVSTSKSEGFGNAYIEAMAAGCPSVVSDIPAHMEISNNQGLKFQVGDCVELANHILRLCSDEKYFQEAALIGIQNARNYSIEFTANAYRSLYGNKII